MHRTTQAVDLQVRNFVRSKKLEGESFNYTLRRLLSLDKNDWSE